jgi:hypothetical protein
VLQVVGVEMWLKGLKLAKIHIWSDASQGAGHANHIHGNEAEFA